jgi:DNA repair exonuclease SbcCD ATPase subunit
MQITGIQIKNYAGIRFLNLTTLKKINLVTGDNAVGKSSLTNAIREAFDPSSVNSGTAVRSDLIHGDAEKAEILISLDGNVEIMRKITEASNTVTVKVDGAVTTAPQRLLREMCGAAMLFNPIDFMSAKPKERRDLLLRAFPVDMTQEWLEQQLGDAADAIRLGDHDFSRNGLLVLDDIATRVYGLRREVNVKAIQMAKSIDQEREELTDVVNPEAYEGFDLTAAADELSKADRAVDDNDAKVTKKDRLLAAGKAAITEIEALEGELERVRGELAQIKVDGKALAAEIAAFTPPDTDALREKIAGFEGYQEQVGKMKAIIRREADHEELVEHHQILDVLHRSLMGVIPRKLIAIAKLPFEGLEVRGDDILIDDVEFSQRSKREQWVTCVDIAKSLIPKDGLKVICCDNFESLSPANFNIFMAIADKDEFEYFITKVTDGELTINDQKPDITKGK